MLFWPFQMSGNLIDNVLVISVPVPAEYRAKEKLLKEIICQKRQLSLEQLRNHAKSPGGFITGMSVVRDLFNASFTCSHFYILLYLFI